LLLSQILVQKDVFAALSEFPDRTTTTDFPQRANSKDHSAVDNDIGDRRPNQVNRSAWSAILSWAQGRKFDARSAPT
jgi:hypothetical protein